jgi:hypothetical protein
LTVQSHPVGNQRDFLPKCFGTEFALERLKTFVLHLLMANQRRVVGEGGFAFFASVAVLVFQIVVHREFGLVGKSFVAELADVFTSLVDDFQVIVLRFPASNERRKRSVGTETVFLVCSKFRVESEAMQAVRTFYGSRHVVVSVEVRVQRFLRRVRMARALITLKLTQLHVN